MDNFRILSVKQPWAAALVLGIKDVENRSRHLPKTMPLPTRVLIHASKSKPTKKDMRDFEQRLAANTVKPAPGTIPNFHECGSIIGMVEIGASLDSSPSVWFNGEGNKAWCVTKAWNFPHPIRNIKGSQTPNRFLKTHPQRDEIYAALPDIIKKIF